MAGADTAQPVAPRQSKILLAEDNAVNMLLARDMLARCGQKVHLAKDGDQAVVMTIDAAMRGEPFDLILMDIQMPEMNGIEAIEAIRADGNTIPIIALTALAMPGDRERCLAVGADDYLSKPISLRQLVVAIEKLLVV